MAKQFAFEAWLACIEAEQPGVLATILQTESQEPVRMFIPLEDTPIGDLGDTAVNKQITQIARQKLHEKKPRSETQTMITADGEEVSVFIDVYMPPIDILIFGAGHDAIPVANYCVSLGFRTTVVDARAHYNSEERFPGAIRIIAGEENFREQVKISSRTNIIVMNHHLEKDQATLQYVLTSSALYIGALGPRSRCMRMLDALQEEGIVFSDCQLGRLYSPVGLNIGADTPEAIAISIVAEIIAINNGQDGGFLKGSDTIHQRAGATC